MSKTLCVTVWNEYLDEKQKPEAASHYPKGIHGALAESLADTGWVIHTATLQEAEHGLPPARLDATDVLIWWSHSAYDEVTDAVVERVHQRVLAGMGLIVLHSAHFSKLFKRLMGTSCNLKWREAGERERLWVVAPNHPIAEGLNEYFELPQEEMYGEYFDVPPPEQLVFISWFSGGEVFRSGCCYQRGLGRIFYFRPGHETYPTYHNRNVQRVICNAVRWAAPTPSAPPRFGYQTPLET